MIDCEKLKIVHELAAKLPHAKLVVELRVDDDDDDDEEYYKLNWFDTYQMPFCYGTYDIDDLITKLKELVEPPKPEPRYKDAWYLLNNKPLCTKAMSGEGYAYCSESNPEAFGLKLFPTKQALIEHQIEYWLSLSEKSPTELLCDSIVDRAQKRLDDTAKYLNKPDRDLESQMTLTEWSKTDSGKEYLKSIGKSLADGVEKDLSEYQPKFEGEIKGFKCQHEPDNLYHGIKFNEPVNPKDQSNPPTYYEVLKCIKCGEFYK